MLRTSCGWRPTSKPPTVARATVGRQERGEDANGRGLARTVRAEEPDNRSLGNEEVDAVERSEVAEPFDEAFGGHAARRGLTRRPFRRQPTHGSECTG